jgi:hypothetical protein
MTSPREEAPCIACGAPSCSSCGACHEEDCPACSDILCDYGDGEPAGPNDLSDDAEALASAGRGTDEDYGYFGGEDD